MVLTLWLIIEREILNRTYLNSLYRNYNIKLIQLVEHILVGFDKEIYAN